jgi:hypothetical protein
MNSRVLNYQSVIEEEVKDITHVGSESPACCGSQDHKDCVTFRSHRRNN